jgi:hypothetical protein
MNVNSLVLVFKIKTEEFISMDYFDTIDNVLNEGGLKFALKEIDITHKIITEVNYTIPNE